MKYYHLNVKVEDEIAYVLLNRPAEENRFNLNMSQELLSLANEFIEKDDIKVIVLGSNGESFSKGLLVGDNPLNEDMGATMNLAANAIEAWARIPYPIIAAVKGKCSSLGLSLACVSDIRYAQSNSTFSIPEVNNGLVPGGGITQRLPRLIGKGPSMSMLLGGDEITADTAFDWGLINEVINEDEVWDVACNEAKRFAEMSTLSMQYTKECLLRGSELSMEQALRLELDMYMVLQTGSDRMEGVNAFLEKRSANFKGV